MVAEPQEATPSTPPIPDALPVLPLRGTLVLLVQGLQRARLAEFVQTEPYMKAKLELAPEEVESDVQLEGLQRAVLDLFRELVRLTEGLPDELIPAAEALSDARQLAYLVASTIPIDLEVRQELLELDPVGAKLSRLVELLQHEIAVRELGRKITSQTQERMSKAQREYFLREQLRSIQRELGDDENPELA